MGYFQIIRVDGSSRRYSSMIKMLQNIDREDLETLYKLVKAKHGNTRPEEAYERVLWGDLKVMFKPDVESKKINIKSRGIVGIKRLHDDLGVNTAKVRVTAAKHNLVLCLTSRLTGHDQSKINVLQIFHDVINKVHVDYASLLWWDFLHYVQQKKNVIQYPLFTKLIITDLIEKYESIPKRLEEDFHTIKDDTMMVNVYTIREVTVRGMLITNDLLIDAIRDMQAYKDYVEKF
ncbi:hypothetical protein Tco_1562171 [Tanacetum coccineum]